jgi:uncharacterized membrane protein YdcZ (DUF606 family)
MTWLLLLPVALAAGMAAPTQFAINSQLDRSSAALFWQPRSRFSLGP